MSNPTFNTNNGQQIAREKLVAYLNTNTAVSPTWSPIGYTVPESSVEYDWGEDTSQDILGVTRTTMKKPTVTQSFEDVKLQAGDPAYELVWVKGVQNQDPSALCNLDILIVHLYAGTASAPFAERYPQSSLRPTSIGGEGGGFLTMPFEVTYGGEREVGTVEKTYTYAKTSDVALATGKTYYTESGGAYTEVAEPNVSNIGNYYERTGSTYTFTAAA